MKDDDMKDDDIKDDTSTSSLSDISDNELEKLSVVMEHAEKYYTNTKPGKSPQPPNLKKNTTNSPQGPGAIKSTPNTPTRLKWGSPRRVTADGVVYVPDSEEESDAEDRLVDVSRERLPRGCKRRRGLQYL